MLFMTQMQISHSFYQFFSLLATNAFHGSKTNIAILLSKCFPPPPSWQLMLFMIQMQILHSFYQFFPPPSWQLMLFMTQMQISHSFYQFFSLLAINAFHDSKTNIAILLSKCFPPPPSWQLMLFMIQMQIFHSFYQFFPPPLGN